MVVDVGDAQGLHGGSTDAQEHLGPNEQQVHHVGGGPVAADEVRIGPLVAGRAIRGADVAALGAPEDLAGLVLVLVGQELGQGGQQRPQGHDDAPAADEAGPVPACPEVADEEDERQVPDLEAAGDHPHVGALQVEPPLQGGQHAHLQVPNKISVSIPVDTTGEAPSGLVVPLPLPGGLYQMQKDTCARDLNPKSLISVYSV